MKQTQFIFLILLSTVNLYLPAQEAITVNKARFSSDIYDELAPVFFKNGIVFTTNRNKVPLLNYSGPDDKGQLKIFYIDTTSAVKWQRSGLLSNRLTSKMNDGPATFNKTFDTIYFSRNLMVEGNLNNLSGNRNKLGLFRAVFDGNKWDKVQEFRFNNENYNITTPFLTEDGSKIFFASDRPDSYGGLDIYYSLNKNGYWEEPVNLGPAVNTKGNESFPFLNESGELFFSSDGHGGLGGKDIFVTWFRNNTWIAPVNLGAPINSEHNDYGILTDPTMNSGYFSSDREKTVDIFQFKFNFFNFWLCEPQKENQYCYTISDQDFINVDTLNLQYLWNFGDRSISYQPRVIHCFPGNGNYNITLDIIDRKTGKLFFHKYSGSVKLFNNQPFITSPDISVIGEPVSFDGLKSLFPGYTISGYYWDFGDKTIGTGERVTHIYAKPGEFTVRFGVTLVSQSTGEILRRSVSRKILIFDSPKERSSYQNNVPEVQNNPPDIRNAENGSVKNVYSAEDLFRSESEFQVVLLSSPTKIPVNKAIFKNVPSDYDIKEEYDTESARYFYIVDQQLTLMETYISFKRMITAGYKDAFVRICELQEPAGKELFRIRKNYSLLTDENFDANERMTTVSYIMLDQVAQLMSKYPDIKVEVGVHTDDIGIPASLQWLSLKRAQVIVNYLVGRGISEDRLTAVGYGNKKPVTSNNFPTDKRINRRIEFTIIEK